MQHGLSNDIANLIDRVFTDYSFLKLVLQTFFYLIVILVLGVLIVDAGIYTRII